MRTATQSRDHSGHRNEQNLESVLDGWMGGGDRQVIYPNRIWPELRGPRIKGLWECGEKLKV